MERFMGNGGGMLDKRAQSGRAHKWHCCTKTSKTERE
jgi:hypothetical protein